MSALSYAAITPVHATSWENLLRLGSCAGGADDSAGTLDRRRQRLHRRPSRRRASWPTRLPWIRVIEMPGTASPQPGAPIVKAFHAGLRALDVEPDVVVKLDADVSMEPDYFERQLGAFEADDRLGISSGTCLELEDGGVAAHGRRHQRARARCGARLSPCVPRGGPAARGARRLGRARRDQGDDPRLEDAHAA